MVSVLDSSIVIPSLHRFLHKNPQDPSEVPGGFLSDINPVSTCILSNCVPGWVATVNALSCWTTLHLTPELSEGHWGCASGQNSGECNPAHKVPVWEAGILPCWLWQQKRQGTEVCDVSVIEQGLCMTCYLKTGASCIQLWLVLDSGVFLWVSKVMHMFKKPTWTISISQMHWVKQ